MGFFGGIGKIIKGGAKFAHLPGAGGSTQNDAIAGENIRTLKGGGASEADAVRMAMGQGVGMAGSTLGSMASGGAIGHATDGDAMAQPGDAGGWMGAGKYAAPGVGVGMAQPGGRFGQMGGESGRGVGAAGAGAFGLGNYGGGGMARSQVMPRTAEQMAGDVMLPGQPGEDASMGAAGPQKAPPPGHMMADMLLQRRQQGVM